MPRKVKTIVGPSRLSGILASLNREPRPALAGIQKLTLSYAAKHDHMGARHFVREELPRIRYANPNLSIEVQPVSGQVPPGFAPKMVLERVDGTTNDIPLALKWSTTILGELLDKAGTASWSAWKTKQRQAGLPILENYGRAVEKHDPLKPKKKQGTKGQAQVKPKPKSTTGEAPVEVVDLNVSAETKADLDKARSGTGAAAILP